ncbi:tetratricopeptide repeat-containing sensor histidine kinase [Parapedobacter sp. DT-150]|uniref:tetratricopeptide repeat-containing sensor histidine kinase n=1 Tax=Parapedobacter sp. DT-150 TaxID=3396162 RepID=UPI003F53FB95
MKQLVLSLIGACCCIAVAAQSIPLDRQRHADSLERALSDTEQSDSLRARAAYLLCEFWSYLDTAKAKTYLEKGRRLAGNSPYTRARHQFYIGQLYRRIDRTKSEDAYLRVDSILARHGIVTKSAFALRSNAWNNYAILQQIKDDNESTIAILLNKVIPYSKKAELPTYTALTYADVGTLFANQREYAKAAPYFEQSLQQLDTLEIESSARVNVYLAAAVNYISMDSLKLGRRWQDSVRRLLADHTGSRYYLEYLEGEGRFYRKSGNYARSLDSIEAGIALAEDLNDTLRKEGMLNEKFLTLFQQGNYQAAERVLSGVAQHPVTPFAATRAVYYTNLAETYEKLGDMHNAFRWQKAYSVLSDSLHETHYKEKMHQLETRYRTAENTREIATLKAGKTAAELEANNNRLFNWLLGAVCLFLLAATIFSLAYYRSHRRLTTQQEINHRQQLREMEQQQELAVTRAMLEGEERERKRVARDLHDGLGGMLAGVKFNLSGWAANHLHQPNDTDFYRVIEQLDNSVGELRRIARNMMPETLLKFGLETALKDLSEFYMHDGLHIDFQPFGIDRNISLPLQITIYRIVQELLSNAVRHGHASDIVLQCSQHNRDFLITVEDNGIGFDTKRLSGKTGLGLENVKNRVEYYKGKIEIISSPNEGTAIHLELHDHGAG